MPHPVVYDFFRLYALLLRVHPLEAYECHFVAEPLQRKSSLSLAGRAGGPVCVVDDVLGGEAAVPLFLPPFLRLPSCSPPQRLEAAPGAEAALLILPLHCPQAEARVEVLVDADVTFPQRDPSSYLRRYSISRLPLTERLMREAGCLSIIHSQNARLFEEGMKNAMGTSPKTVAERALLKADAEVFSALSHDRRARAALLAGQVGVRITNGLVVRSELKAWED